MNYQNVDEDILIDIDTVRLVNNLRTIRTRKQYTFYQRINHINIWNDNEFVRRFRLSKNSVNELVEILEPHLRHRVEKNCNVDPMLQVLITLRFLATGNFYITVGDFGGIHKSTASRIIPKVIYALAALRENYIKFPNTVQMRKDNAISFYDIARFPKVIGALDCTHIKLQSPGGNNAENFRNRKGFFSLNVQAICNSKNYICDIVTHWPGSAHDSHIFNNSFIRMRFERGEFDDYILLGDSGYPLRSYLLTPLENPAGNGEGLYNESQIRTRNIIERTFGIWKRRFPILSLGIRTKLPLAQAIIVATAILHNIACKNRDTLPENDIDHNDDHNDDQMIDELNFSKTEDKKGKAIQKEFINYFNDLL